MLGDHRAMTRALSPEEFFAQLFSSKAACTGAVVRRQVRDVERLVGRDAFLKDVRRRGFAVIENAGQFAVFCNSEPLRRVA